MFSPSLHRLRTRGFAIGIQKRLDGRSGGIILRIVTDQPQDRKEEENARSILFLGRVPSLSRASVSQQKEPLVGWIYSCQRLEAVSAALYTGGGIQCYPFSVASHLPSPSNACLYGGRRH